MNQADQERIDACNMLIEFGGSICAWMVYLQV